MKRTIQAKGLSLMGLGAAMAIAIFLTTSVSAEASGEDQDSAFTPPQEKHLELKEFYLELINAERRKAGVGEVVLGANSAAQLKADYDLEHCASSHWTLDGLDPTHRYTLAGGQQTNSENTGGWSHCFTNEERAKYRSLGPLRAAIQRDLAGYMDSPGHKANILDPWHKKVNLGLAWDSHAIYTVQHFEGDYIDCSTLPGIEGSVLSLNCTTKEVFPSNAYSVGLGYTPEPTPLTRGQLARTYGYYYPNDIAYLRGQPGEGYTWTNYTTEVTHYSGCTPYDIDEHEPAPSSIEESRRLHEEAKSCERAESTATVPYIDGDESIQERTIILSVDIADIVQRYGAGIYTVDLWGCTEEDAWDEPCEDENTSLILEYPIFYGFDPPDTWAHQTKEGLMLTRYDADESGAIDKEEVIAAIDDYLDGTELLKKDVIYVIDYYLDQE